MQIMEVICFVVSMVFPVVQYKEEYIQALTCLWGWIGASTLPEKIPINLYDQDLRANRKHSSDCVAEKRSEKSGRLPRSSLLSPRFHHNSKKIPKCPLPKNRIE